jgi:hypothetical protein
MEWLASLSAKDGIFAAIVVYLLVTDRLDRIADRKFYAQYFQDKQKGN